jgi:hypothetical protein
MRAAYYALIGKMTAHLPSDAILVKPFYHFRSPGILAIIIVKPRSIIMVSKSSRMKFKIQYSSL